MMATRLQAPLSNSIAEDVLQGLSAPHKHLPPKLFYDARGSELFEQITELPEYYLTRTEHGILERSAAEIIQQAGTNLTLVEMGAGSATKTRLLIEAILRRQLGTTFYPVDVSPAALHAAVCGLNGDYPTLQVSPLVADYTQHMPNLRELPGRKLALFIGSTIGNFGPDEAVEFLIRLRQALGKNDAVLLGFDMNKSAKVLHAAYNDAQGVTAAFNKNLLARMNRDLGATFDPATFRHVALWNSSLSRIEMHLESQVEQTVVIKDLGRSFHFDEGERIHTENSYKFSKEAIRHMVRRSGLRLERTWTDRHGWFSEVLGRV